MGEWEKDESVRCTSCGAVLAEPKVTKKGVVQRHFYKLAGKILCPACWTTARVHPNIVRSA